MSMISEDHVTDDWSNDAEYSALHHRNKLKKYYCITILLFYALNKHIQTTERYIDIWNDNT